MREQDLSALLDLECRCITLGNSQQVRNLTQAMIEENHLISLLANDKLLDVGMKALHNSKKDKKQLSHAHLITHMVQEAFQVLFLQMLLYFSKSNYSISDEQIYHYPMIFIYISKSLISLI